MVIVACCTFFDSYHEFMPVVSTVTSLKKIFEACVLQREDVFLKTHNFINLRKKSALRVVVLIVPVFGNLLVAIYDLKKYQEFIFTLKTVQQNGLSLQYASDENKSNQIIVTTAFKENVKSLEFADFTLKNDQTFIKDLISQDITALYFASDKIRQNESFVAEMIEKHGIKLLEFAHPDLQNNKSFILKLLKKDPLALKYAANLRKCKKFVSEIVLEAPINFKYAHADLRSDKEYVKELMQKNIKVFEYAKDLLRLDEGFVLSEIQQNKEVLKYSLLNSNKNFIGKCLKKDLSILAVAGDEIRNDKEFIVQFKADNFKIIKYASEALNNDEPFIMECMRDHGLSLEHLNFNCKNNEKIVLNFVTLKRSEELQWMGAQLFANYRFAKEAVSIDGKALNFFHESIINHEETLLIALKTTPSPLNKINSTLRNNKEFFRKAITIHGEILRFASDEIQDDYFFVLSLIEINYDAMKFCRYNDNEEFILELIRRGHISVLKDADEDLRDDEDFMPKVLALNTKAFQFAGNNIRKNTRFMFNYIYYAEWQQRSCHQNIFKCADDSIWYDKTFIMTLIYKDFNPVHCMSEGLYKNREFIIQLVNFCPKIFKFLNDDYKNDEAFKKLAKGYNKSRS